jgi:hypothetical protein
VSLAALTAVLVAGCDLAYPEVVVVNRTAEHVLLRNPSFNGCVWNVVLGYGETTSPGSCLPGEDRVHFQMLDAAQYCRDQAEDRTLVEPLWFNYRTISLHRVDYRDFAIVEVTLDDMEQDFSVPGPYGH